MTHRITPRKCPKCQSKDTYKAVIGRKCNSCGYHYTMSALEAMQYGAAYVDVRS